MEDAGDDDDDDEGGLLRNEGEALKELFDVFPVRGVIEPGAQRSIEFTFCGLSDSVMSRCFAVCSVEGGPDYRLRLSGGSTSPKYRVDPADISFGNVFLNRPATREVRVTNTGQIPFLFHADLSAIAKSLWVLDVSPTHGVIEPAQTLPLSVSVRPGCIEFVDVTFSILIGGGYRVPISVRARGVHAELSIQTPNAVNSILAAAAEEGDLAAAVPAGQDQGLTGTAETEAATLPDTREASNTRRHTTVTSASKPAVMVGGVIASLTETNANLTRSAPELQLAKSKRTATITRGAAACNGEMLRLLREAYDGIGARVAAVVSRKDAKQEARTTRLGGFNEESVLKAVEEGGMTFVRSTATYSLPVGYEIMTNTEHRKLLDEVAVPGSKKSLEFGVAVLGYRQELIFHLHNTSPTIPLSLPVHKKAMRDKGFFVNTVPLLTIPPKKSADVPVTAEASEEGLLSLRCSSSSELGGSTHLLIDFFC
eukprot:GHVU01210044.1.p1 GENE.GHVU01210044.1~~GHVU01210044.1.p1  ORF type:complete len:498 (+),score=56.16 GHVU01210044.1:50-1495(+)